MVHMGFYHGSLILGSQNITISRYHATVLRCSSRKILNHLDDYSVRFDVLTCNPYELDGERVRETF